MFKEFSTELIYFVKQLHSELIESKQKNVFFLAREGQFLKSIFDLIVKKEGSQIKSHYLEVSRSSTFLPSLKCLKEETFQTLFRQYNNISGFEFLQNLNLEHIKNDLIVDIKVDKEKFCLRINDFQQSKLLTSILNSEIFIKEYESKRLKQRQLIIDYITQYSDLENGNFCIVDVGWKGTIQDHLTKILGSEQKNITINGYYIGLLHPTGLSDISFKKGLIFSNDEKGKSRGYNIFNENRALYELILSADHGSAKDYQKNDKGIVTCAHQEFVEKDQFFTLIKPVQKSLFHEISKIIVSDKYDIIDFHGLIKKHRRLVFDPTLDEVEWFEKVFQFENFGLFENTEFITSNSRFSKIIVLKRILKGDLSILGFWPYIFIKKIYGKSVAKVYVFFQTLSL